MKSLFTLLFAALAFVATAQPQKIHYQGVAVGANGKPLKNSTVGLRLSVLDSLPNGTTLYTETQAANTDAAGQFSIYLGAGSATTGIFANLPWANGNDKFLKVEMDAQGGSNYQPMGTTQLVSVPYAMAAGTAMVIDEGTLLRMKNGHIYRLDYPLNGQGPVWNAIGGVTQATISQDTIYTCFDSIWIFGNKVKSHEFSQWQVLSPFSLNQNFNSPDHDSLQVFRNWGDTLIFQYVINPLGNGGGTTDKVVVIFSSHFTKANAGADIQTINDSTAKLGANFPKAGEIGTWSILSGNGGILDSISDPQATFTKGPDSIYTLIWTISGPCESTKDTVVLVFDSIFTDCGKLLNYFGENYLTVQIGSQCWFAQNLNVGMWINWLDTQSNNNIVEKFCTNNDSGYCSGYGGLYQWKEAVQYQNGGINSSFLYNKFIKGVCPNGWHIPFLNEWTTLEQFLGGGSYAAMALKSIGGWPVWDGINPGTNSSGFNAFPTGGGVAAFWSAEGDNVALLDDIDWLLKSVGYNLEEGLSVRCLKDTCFSSKANAGEDQIIESRINTKLNASPPELGEIGEWSILSGTGGFFSSIHDPYSTFTKGLDSFYVLTWKIIGPCTTKIDTICLSFNKSTINTTCTGYSTVVFEAEVYPTIQIGTQCWLAKNLNVGNFTYENINQIDNNVVEKYCYDNNPRNCDIYGGLYQWAEAVQYQNGASNFSPPNPAFSGKIKGICPNGWHLPNNDDWKILENFLGGPNVAGGYLKSNNILWDTINIGATNSSGFSALPSGCRCSLGSLGSYSGYWSISSDAMVRGLGNNTEAISVNNANKLNSFSVRCLLDTCISTPSCTSGPDQIKIFGTRANLSANFPAPGETGNWNIINGNGGVISSFSSPTAIFTKGLDSSYTLVWSITNSCGTSRDTLFLQFSFPDSLTCGKTLNYFGENYPTIQIGTQCWMRKNLNVYPMASNTTISTGGGGRPVKACYNNDLSYCNKYGGLYTWWLAVKNLERNSSGNIKGICPSGWHLPSNSEWNVLETNLGGPNIAGATLKSTSGLWKSPNYGANDSSGFSALPGGEFNTDGSFFNQGVNAFFWSSSDSSNSNAYLYNLNNYNSNLIQSNRSKFSGASVRCIMDICNPTVSFAGPDQLSLLGTTAALAANSPLTGETGDWSILTGSGSLSASNDSITTFTKGTDSAYTLVWTITGPCGTSTDTVNLLFPTPLGTSCGQAMTYAGESYPTVQIGNQCWFAKNLNVGIMVNSISGISSDEQTNNDTIEKFCYDNGTTNCTTYGGLYQWAEAVQYQYGASNTDTLPTNFIGHIRGICPTGWHIPSDAEYCTLTTFLDSSVNCGAFGWNGSDVGGKMKATNGLWIFPNTGATNSSGISALPCGQRATSGWFKLFNGLGNKSGFWSSSESSATSATLRNLDNNLSTISRNSDSKSFGLSVRCLKD